MTRQLLQLGIALCCSSPEPGMSLDSTLCSIFGVAVPIPASVQCCNSSRADCFTNWSPQQREGMKTLACRSYFCSTDRD
ncbi:hypothetical protein SKAU_G00122590 [Synaphobranchus kaupii]|uniref:Uncharacterized protein n=1 Tax=Synaphobranchus kaupii TaxID=118154 RepID=A0A9Q1FPN4_SYNKA|nr:hypothetical protein SKAU_G00122590 [Synaphobranchus kaupii]